MIYRIHHDDRFLTFEIPMQEVLDKLGRAYPFHIDRSPVAYSSVWKEPLEIVFRPPENATQNQIPDLAEADGKLFFSERAHSQLKNMMEEHGEFLPVTHARGRGYLFNILTIAEKVSGLDEKLTGYDRYGNLEHFGFHEGTMDKIPLFRAELDNYQGIFCSDAIKKVIEEASFTGVLFSVDLGNPLMESYSTLQ